MSKCACCEQIAQMGIEPPLCWEHLDMAILLDFLTWKNQPRTLESAEEMLRRSLENGGEWHIGLADLPRLMAGPVAQNVVVSE